MKAFVPELAAVAAVHGPVLTRAEQETYAMLGKLAATTAHIKTVPREVRVERGADAIAAVATLADIEAVRAAFWKKAPMLVREVAVMSVGMDAKRAGDNLNKFNALERGRINVALQKLMLGLTQVQRCMAGGQMPAGRAAGVMDHAAGLADPAKHWTAH